MGDRAKRQGMLAPDAKCTFAVEREDSAETPAPLSPTVTFDSMALHTVDFSTFVDSTPITVHPRLPLETAMELFKKMGPRVILVEHHGTFEGLVTVKDCLKYQFKTEHIDHAAQQQNEPQSSDKLGDVIQRVSEWFADRINNLSRGKLKLSPRQAQRWQRVPTQAQDHPADDYRNESEILDGTEFVIEDEPDGVEMDVR